MKTSGKAFSAGLRVGGLYDSRVGSADAGGDIGSDTGYAATLSAGWQVPMEGDFGFRLDYNGYANFHQDYDRYDVIDQSISIEPQHTMGQLTFSFPMAFNYAMQDGRTDYTKYTISPALTYLIPDTQQAIAVYGIGSIIDDRDSLRDEDGNVIRDRSGNLIHEDANSLGAGCAYILFFEKASRIRLSLDYQHSKYDAHVIDYGTTSVSTDQREDDLLIAGLDIQYQFTDIFGIYANYSFVHSNSNVDLNEYNQHIVEAGIALKY